MKRTKKYTQIMNMFLDQGVCEDVARLKAEIAEDDILEMQIPDVYTPMVFDRDWDYLEVMLGVSKMIQKRALNHMRSSRARTFKPKVVLCAIRRQYPKLFGYVHDAWAINAVTYAKCNHELNLRGEITREEATKRSSCCIWYVDCHGLEIDFENNKINVMKIDGSGTFSIGINNLKNRKTLRNIKLEREGQTTQGLKLTYHHLDDVTHEHPHMQKLIKEALSETKRLTKVEATNEKRDLVELILTLEQ